MKTTRRVLAGLMAIGVLATSCNQKDETTSPESRDHVFNTTFQEIRLGDGVPLDLNVAIRWKVEDYEKFLTKFESLERYDSTVLHYRGMEIAGNVSNTFSCVDSVFTSHRMAYLEDLKEALKHQLIEENVSIEDIMISEVTFPRTFTKAMEDVAMKERELAAIRQNNIVELQKAEAAKKTAAANGQVAIERAKADGELAKIEAKTEESRRLSMIAIAQTESKVAEMKAKDEAIRMDVLAQSETKKKREFNKLEVEKKEAFQRVELEKQRNTELLAMEMQLEKDKLAMQKELDMAKMCMENPAYAAFLVNKELASKVQIAVLRAGGNGEMFGDLLTKGMAKN